MSKSANLTDIVLSILDIKLANSTVFFSNKIEILSYYNTFNWLISSINQVKISKSINSFLNSVLLYCKLVDQLKTYGAEVIREIVLSLCVIRYLKTLLAKILTIIIDLNSCSWLKKAWNYSDLVLNNSYFGIQSLYVLTDISQK